MRNSRFKIRRDVIPLGICDIFTQRFHKKKVPLGQGLSTFWRFPAHRLSTFTLLFTLLFLLPFFLPFFFYFYPSQTIYFYPSSEYFYYYWSYSTSLSFLQFQVSLGKFKLVRQFWKQTQLYFGSGAFNLWFPMVKDQYESGRYDQILVDTTRMRR